MEAAVRPLPAAVQSLLQSSSHISSFRRAVEELVYNSLDSKATSIAVRINHLDCSIQVIDNGSGITKHNMAFIGSKYMTNKCADIEDIKSTSSLYGFRGVALASLVDVSAHVKITSRHGESEVTFAKEYRNGKLENIYETVSRPAQGTTVEIREFLYNLEIQRKIINPAKELQNVKSFLEHTVIFHNGVSFSLRDDVKNAVILKIPKSKDIFQTIDLVYGLKISENIQELQVEKNHFKVKAFLGMKSIEDDNFQLIYLNGRYVMNSKLNNIMNLSLSKIFTSDNKKINKHARTREENGLTKKSNPFYIIFVSCPYNAYDMTQMTSKTLIEFHNWNLVNGLLKTLATVFAESLKPKYTADHDKKLIAQDIMPKTTICTGSINNNGKVTSIVERILKSDPRKLHAQNGIKGKPAKRLKKKQCSKFGKLGNGHSKNKSHHTINKLVFKSTKPTNKASTKSHVEIVLSKDLNVSTNTGPPKIKKEQSIETRKKRLSKKNIIKKHKVRTKQSHGKKSITEVFQNFDGSIKERCKDVSIKADNLLQKYNKKSYCKESKIENIKEKNKDITKNNRFETRKIESIQKRSREIIIREFIQIPANCNSRLFLKTYYDKYLQDPLPNQQALIKSRYDLIQTIIKSQHTNVNNHAMMKLKETKKLNNAENHQIPLQIDNDNVLTYQSHCYDQGSTQYGNDHCKDIMEYKTEILNSIKHVIQSKFNLRNVNFAVPPKRTINKNNANTVNISAEIHNTDKGTVMKQKSPFKKPSTINEMKSNHSKLTTNTFQDSSYLQEPSNANDILTEITVYNFDEEVNKPISLSLTCQVMPSDIKNQSHNHGSPQIDCNNKVMANDIENKYMNNTYTVKYPTMPECIENSRNVSVDYINDTITNLSVIAANHNYVQNEMRIESESRHFLNEPVANCVTGYSNDYTNIEYGFGNAVELVENQMEVTFTSRSFPHGMKNEMKNLNKLVDMNPINVCQTIMESSDIFDTDSFDIEMFACYKNGENIRETPNEHFMEYEDNQCSKFGQEITDQMPNGQVYQLHSEYVDEMCADSLNNVFLNDTFQTTLSNPIANQNTPGLNIEVIQPPCNTIGNMEKAAPCMKEDNENNVDPVVNINLAEGIDDNGRMYFLDVKTGMTFPSNCIASTDKFSVKRRPNYIPKGFSPILQCKVDIKATELPSQEYFTKSLYDNFVNDVDKCSEVYEATVENVANTKESAPAGNRFRKLNASIVFDGAAIATAKVLKQVDNKFITCLMDGRQGTYLVLFDQHAVDERIHLETLLKEYKTETVWRSVACDKFSLSVTHEERFYLENFESKFKELGLVWDSPVETEISMVAVPLAMVGKHSRKMDVIATATKKLIRELVKTLRTTHNLGTPQTLMDLVNMEACRLSVKFGDALTRGECAGLVRALARCAAPFQCAHGRPDMALLLAVTPLERCYKINMEALKKFKLK